VDDDAMHHDDQYEEAFHDACKHENDDEPPGIVMEMEANTGTPGVHGGTSGVHGGTSGVTEEESAEPLADQETTGMTEEQDATRMRSTLDEPTIQ
jgi:hypothetical protein